MSPVTDEAPTAHISLGMHFVGKDRTAVSREVPLPGHLFRYDSSSSPAVFSRALVKRS